MHISPYDFHYRRALRYDYNRDGFISRKELPRTPDAKRVVDRNLDNRISVLELADGFRRTDVKIRGDELRAWFETEVPYPNNHIYFPIH